MTDTSFDFFKAITLELDPLKIKRNFLMSLLKIQNVERGSIWIKQQNSYKCIEAAGRQSEKVEGAIIDARQPSVVGWVIENGKMTVSDPRTDVRHNKEFEEQLDVKSRMILCFPLVLSDQTVYGAVQIIDTSAGKTRINLDTAYLKHIRNLVDIGSIALSNALLYSRKAQEARSLKNTLAGIRGENVIIGEDATFLKAIKLIRVYGQSDFPVLITGESGTGKDLISQKIHAYSNRRLQPFLVQNCSAIPETLLESELFGYKKGAFSGAVQDKIGLFEAADGGTVFLDEIGDMPHNLQARILRVVQNGEIKPVGDTRVKKVDVRIISATNQNLQKMVTTNEFRRDLYYRLSVLPLHLPPLRQRQTDIPALLDFFLEREAGQMNIPVKRIQPDALQRLIAYPWLGNVREVENLVRYLMVATDGERIGLADLPEFLEQAHLNPETNRTLQITSTSTDHTVKPDRETEMQSSDMTWEEMERAYARHLLLKHKGNFSNAAKSAGLNRSTFVSRLRRLGVKREEGQN